MRYLLDVNALVAFGFFDHALHLPVTAWVRSLGSPKSFEFASCSITELGFVRVLAQAAPYSLSVADARELLQRVKASAVFRFCFIPDDHDISHLPAWVRASRETTDGHLSQLARAKGATFVTLDRKIPGALLIPTG